MKIFSNLIIKYSNNTEKLLTNEIKNKIKNLNILIGNSYDDCTHIICDSNEYENIKLKIRLTNTIYFINKKWIDDILNYEIRFQEIYYLSDPFYFLSCLKIVILINSDYLDDLIGFCNYYGADVYFNFIF